MNPAVERLLAHVEHPLYRTVLLQAMREKEPVQVEHVPEELLEPLFILAMAGREYGERKVDDLPLLRKRIEDEPLQETVAQQLLAGASFRNTEPTYPPSASVNCGPGEIQLHYLPLGARFRLVTEYQARTGTLIDKTPSRATVEWEGGKAERSFTDRRNGATVIIDASSKRTGCALECAVTPIHTAMNPEDVAWVMNAYKEVTGTFDEPKKRKS